MPKPPKSPPPAAHPAPAFAFAAAIKDATSTGALLGAIHARLKRDTPALSLARFARHLGLRGDADKQRKLAHDLINGRRKLPRHALNHLADRVQMHPLELIAVKCLLEAELARSPAERRRCLELFGRFRDTLPTTSAAGHDADDTLRILCAFGLAPSAAGGLRRDDFIAFFGPASAAAIDRALAALVAAGQCSLAAGRYHLVPPVTLATDPTIHRRRLVRAADAIEAWFAKPREALFLTCNLSVRQESYPQFLEDMRRLVHSHCLSADRSEGADMIAELNLTIIPQYSLA